MPLITMEEYHEYPTLPVDSILHLKVDDTEVREVRGERNSWSKLEFKFKILEVLVVGDGSPKDLYDELVGQGIWGSVPYRFNNSPENRLRQWAEACFGMELGIGFELETDMLKNKHVRGITSVYEKRALNPRTGKKYVNHQVDSLLPFGAAGTPATWTPPAVQAPQDPWSSPPPAPAGDPWATQSSAPQQVAAPQQPMATAPAGGSQWALGDEPPF